MKIRGREIRVVQLIALVIYYLVLRYLPSSSSIFFGRFFRFLRYHCCRHIFLECGRNVNVERGDRRHRLAGELARLAFRLCLVAPTLGQIGGTDNRSIGSATLANVGNLITFRLGAVDAIKLAPWLDEPERWRELCQLPDFTMNARLLENGYPVQFQRLRSWGPLGD